MATFKFAGLKALEMQMQKLKEQSVPSAKKAVYKGSKVMADAIKGNMWALDFTSDGAAMAAYNANKPTIISERQKRGLIDGFGVTEIKVERGQVNAKVGFTGYNRVKTKRWPQGQPNVIVARACESGTSHTIKQPFVRPAISAARSATEKAIRDSIETDIKKITGGNK